MNRSDSKEARRMSNRPEGPFYGPTGHYGHRGAYDIRGPEYSPGVARPEERFVPGARVGRYYEDGHGYATDYPARHIDPRTPTSFAGLGPANYRRPDELIADRIHVVLTDDAALDASDIEVRVQDAEVTLAGTAFNRNQKRRAEDIAHMVRGVKHVQNNLRIREGGLRNSAYQAE